MANIRFVLVVLGATAAVSVAVACGSDDPSANENGTAADAGPRGVEQAGQACTAPSQCYGGVDGGADSGALKGSVTCLDKVPNGYCTHECNSDSDCCAVPGECTTGVKQVCSPFTNTDTPRYCFLSCEDADIRTGIAANADAGGYDGGAVDGGTVADEYCRSYASVYATCRSSGGGSQNRKVCIPQQ
jgi:hypothetical protein